MRIRCGVRVGRWRRCRGGFPCQQIQTQTQETLQRALWHLVQVAEHEADEAASLRPDFWTVFNEAKADPAADGRGDAGVLER